MSTPSSVVVESFVLEKTDHRPRLALKEMAVAGLSEAFFESSEHVLPLCIAWPRLPSARARYHMITRLLGNLVNAPHQLAVSAKADTIVRYEVIAKERNKFHIGLVSLPKKRHKWADVIANCFGKVTVEGPVVFIETEQLEYDAATYQEQLQKVYADLSEHLARAERAEDGLWASITKQSLVDELDDDAAAIQRTIDRRNWLLAKEPWLTSEQVAARAGGSGQDQQRPIRLPAPTDRPAARRAKRAQAAASRLPVPHE